VSLNIVTIVAPPVHLLPADMREDVHAPALVNCIVNDDLVNAMPNMQKTMLQYTTLV